MCKTKTFWHTALCIFITAMLLAAVVIGILSGGVQAGDTWTQALATNDAHADIDAHEKVEVEDSDGIKKYYLIPKDLDLKVDSEGYLIDADNNFVNLDDSAPKGYVTVAEGAKVEAIKFLGENRSVYTGIEGLQDCGNDIAGSLLGAGTLGLAGQSLAMYKDRELDEGHYMLGMWIMAGACLASWLCSSCLMGMGIGGDTCVGIGDLWSRDGMWGNAAMCGVVFTGIFAVGGLASAITAVCYMPTPQTKQSSQKNEVVERTCGTCQQKFTYLRGAVTDCPCIIRALKELDERDRVNSSKSNVKSGSDNTDAGAPPISRGKTKGKGRGKKSVSFAPEVRRRRLAPAIRTPHTGISRLLAEIHRAENPP